MMTILQRKTLLQFLLVVATSCSALLQSPPHRLGFRTMRMSTAVATSTGRMLTVQDVAANGRTFANMGMPRVILNKENNEWMLWIHARDENFSTDVVNLSTGRILHATSPDGLTQWKLHEDSPVLNPNKENGGDWFFFDRYFNDSFTFTSLHSKSFDLLSLPLIIIISVNMWVLVM